jgi:hypothetical protein
MQLAEFCSKVEGGTGKGVVDCASVSAALQALDRGVNMLFLNEIVILVKQ